MNFNDLQRERDLNRIDKDSYIDLAHLCHKGLYSYSESLKNSFISEISIDADGVIFHTIMGGRFRIDIEDSKNNPIAALNFGSLEGCDEKLLYRLASVSSEFMDIGANVGWYSIHISGLQNIRKVVSFEALPRTFEMLSGNITLSRRSNILPFNIAISDNNNGLELYWSNAESGSTSIRNLRSREHINKAFVSSIKLDDPSFSLMNPIDWHPDLLKIDVEGSELFVLKGAKDFILNRKPIIFCEILRKWSRLCGYDANEVLLLLESLGYSCFALDGDSLISIPLISEDTMQTNFFFFDKVFHSKKMESLGI